MAISAVLVEATPYLLKYLCTAASASTNSPTVDTTGLIPNNLGATPDLATDALTGSAAGAQGPNTLQAIVNARRNGYKTLAAGTALTQAQARALLASDDPTNAVLANKNVLSCEMFVTARTLNPAGSSVGARPSWACDASVDASGDPTVIIKTTSRSIVPITAYLTIRCRHSYDW